MKNLIFIILIFFGVITNAQHVGIGTTTPSHPLHISTNNGQDPIKIEGLKTSLANDTMLLITDTATGVIRSISISSIVSNSSDTDIDSVTFINDTLYIYEDDKVRKTEILISTSTDDQNIDSLRLNGTILTIYIENGNIANINLQPIVDSALANVQDDNDWDINANGTGLEAAPAGNNIASGLHAIAGGFLNTSSAVYTTISGGVDNEATAAMAVVSGGQINRATGANSSIGGGASNTASGAETTIGGGSINRATFTQATVSGGGSNIASGYASTVSGGRNNEAYSYGEWVGGFYNRPYTPGSTTNWIATDRLFTVGNGQSAATRSNGLVLYKDGRLELNEAYTLPNVDGTVNQVLTTNGTGIVTWTNPVTGGGTDDQNLTVTAGGTNTSVIDIETGTDVIIAGGTGITVSETGSTITIASSGGGSPDNDWNINANTTGLEGAPAGNNIASGLHALTAGFNDSVTGDYSAIIGGQNNLVISNHSIVSAGINNRIITTSGAGSSVIGGGKDNVIDGGTGLFGFQENAAVISGGSENQATARWSTVIGGWRNVASGSQSIAGGSQSIASGSASLALGGIGNDAINQGTIALGGQTNLAAGLNSTTIGGANNISSGTSSATLGGNENAARGNYSYAMGYKSKANNNGSMVLRGYFNPSFNDSLLSSADNQFTSQFIGGYRLITDISKTQGVSLATGAGAWASISDSNKKENFEELAYNEILAKIKSFKVTKWNYKAQKTNIKHIGPMAQDFHKAFGLGQNNTTIVTSDISGVNMAAIKGLIIKNEKLEQENALIKKELAEIKAMLIEGRDK